MASKTFTDISTGSQYSMQISPETGSKIPDIEIQVEVRWTRVTEKLFAAGFQVISFNSALKMYIQYLETRHALMNEARR
ncbi:hypothetical protein FACS1894161_0530 [Spirochaetia bacterium]|nr:hypothetical protein FACS1894161_0530 [Spirochaetia bacterium]